jgi:hypothetical protein
VETVPLGVLFIKAKMSYLKNILVAICKVWDRPELGVLNEQLVS